MQLSIIIPAYNVEEYIGKCLQSIVDGGIKCQGDFEVIVVDDGSPDGSGDIADSFARKHSFIKVIHKRNEGVAAARNTGILSACGKWLYFVDSDDWLADDAVSLLCKRSLENDDADVILLDAYKNMGDRVQVWEHFDKEQIWTDRQEIFRLQCAMLYYPASFPDMKVPLAAPWDKLYKRKFIIENQLKFNGDLKVLDDMIFNMEVFGEAEKVCYFKDKIYHYRYVSDSITNSYKADRVEKDCEVWSYIGKYIEERMKNWSAQEYEIFLQSFYCRIIKSFSICCRLCFFNPKNPKKLCEKIVYIGEILNMQPYADAFHKVHLRNAELKLKVMILMGRMKCTWGIYILHLGQSMCTRNIRNM